MLAADAPARRGDVRERVGAGAVRPRPTPTRSRTCCGTALARRRRAEIDRGLTLVGPHRDELHLTIDGLDARHQASQGEQRTLALALRLAGHVVVHELTGAAPVLLLDDVFSELDAQRAGRARAQPAARARRCSTTAGELPPDVVAERTLAHARRAASRSVDVVTRRDEPVPLRDAIAAVGTRARMPPPDVARRLIVARGPSIVGAAIARARGGALGARRRVHDRGRRTRRGRPSSGTLERPRGPGRTSAAARASVTSVRVVVSRARETTRSKRSVSGTLRARKTPPLTRAFVCRAGVFEHADDGLAQKGSHAWRTAPRTSRF